DVRTTTLRLEPSCLAGPSYCRPGKMTFPVQNFQIAEVSRYPLSVVDDAAVITWLLGFSSACAIDPRLTTPPAARANVHLLNFIRSSCDDVLVRFYEIQGQKQFALDTENGAFATVAANDR